MRGRLAALLACWLAVGWRGLPGCGCRVAVCVVGAGGDVLLGRGLPGWGGWGARCRVVV